ncbi:MAG: glycosyltransferase family 2 protein [Acidobacteria bacterium]|nr:glycosyltransferase family 2 protein [Acidobacteriota bacterium]
MKEPSGASAAVTVIVPAYNEADSLPMLMPSLVAFVQERGWHLIVVDDGSTDATPSALAPYAEAPGVTLLRHGMNRGYGGAVKTGIKAATTDLIVTVDADGQHRLEDLDALHAELQRSGADMVLGNRNRQRSSPYREFGKYLIRRITRILMPLPVRDINSGMRMCRRDLATRYLQLCPDSYAFCDVITLVFIHERRLVVEHSIAMNRRLAGESAVTTKTAFDTVMEILHIVTLFNPDARWRLQPAEKSWTRAPMPRRTR